MFYIKKKNEKFICFFNETEIISFEKNYSQDVLHKTRINLSVELVGVLKDKNFLLKNILKGYLLLFDRELKECEYILGCLNKSLESTTEIIENYILIYIYIIVVFLNEMQTRDKNNYQKMVEITKRKFKIINL
jgi:hypothetical protein